MEELKRCRSASTCVISEWASEFQAILDRSQADVTTRDSTDNSGNETE